MMTATYQRRISARSARVAVFGLLALAAALFPASEARAQWVTSGTNTTTTNSVGIGTPAPSQMFHVHSGGTWAGTRVTTAATGTTINDGVHFGYDDQYGAYIWNREATSVVFSTSNAERMRVGPTGNVGIGTTAPQTSFHVSTASTAIPRGITNEQTSVDNNAALYVFRKSRAGGAALNGDNIGNLYAQAFDGTSFVTGGRLRFAIDGPVAAGSVPTSLQFFTGTAADGVERMRISSAGSVGIGTTTPGILNGFNLTPYLPLHVQGQGATPANVVVDSGSPFSGLLINDSSQPVDSRMWSISQAAGGGKLTFRTYSDSGAVTSDKVVIDRSGNVGVGTNAPVSKLHVAGDITIDGNINAKYQDVAEWVPSTEKLKAGTVVILDPERTNQVLASNAAYDTSVAGVISAQPGISLGEAGEGKVLVATTGRVKVRVDATRAPIKIGDLLVTSDVAGVAMKSEPLAMGGRKFHSPGTIIGKALEPLAGGTGEILVLLSLQ